MLTRCLHDSIAVATAALWGLVGCSSPSPERRQITHQQWFKSCADIGLLSGSITGLCADDDYVYVAGSYTSSRGGIAALSAQSGEIVWQRLGIGLPNLSTPTRIIDKILFTDFANDLHCLSRTNGDLRWHKSLYRRTSGAVNQFSPLTDGHQCYIMREDRWAKDKFAIYAIKAEDGTLTWKQERNRPLKVAIDAAAEMLLLLSLGGDITLLSTHRGKVIASGRISLSGYPIWLDVIGERVLVLTNRSLSSYSIRNWKQLWEVPDILSGHSSSNTAESQRLYPRCGFPARVVNKTLWIFSQGRRCLESYDIRTGKRLSSNPVPQNLLMPCLWEMSETHWVGAFGADDEKVSALAVFDLASRRWAVYDASVVVRGGYRLLSMNGIGVFLAGMEGIYGFGVGN